MLTELKSFKDERNNVINYEGNVIGNMKITFTGSNNILNVSKTTRLKGMTILFDCNNGICNLGNNSFSGFIRIGQDCTVEVGDGVTATGGVYVSTAEGSKVKIGNDCMFATNIEIRSDDAHPIFDVQSGKRINPTRDIIIGNHVWIAGKSSLLNGSGIGDGSILGYGSILKKRIPNNCIAVGVPAKVVKKNIAWERPHLNLVKPFYKPDSSTVSKSDFWNLTQECELLEKEIKMNLFSRLSCALSILLRGKSV
ncbi:MULTISPECIES: acyltransferase [unclassified Pantoea]|uniref:acyltransferase n=1 Tax=unclassified Pantoea TaxID=2630326 RepID=UPI001CD291E8|nr:MULTISPECIES: acyltransferase [unclassified Pantoea]MCA1178222.1 acyltransferase [Pantoea sp. alder69]MCA1251926.1 acyltransferase [Pantoea sp. alder70]MCA1266682.1 acyltransferase [Pantoea sp. alder81]